MKYKICVMGIDVSKDKNAYCIIADGECLETGELPNTRKGIDETVKKAKRFGAWVVFEPTGGYERILKKKLLAAGVPCSMPDAGRIRLYARSLGIDRKNDGVDAEVIARYALQARLRRLECPSKAQSDLQDAFEMYLKCVSLAVALDQDRVGVGSARGVRVLDRATNMFREEEEKFLEECRRIIESDGRMAGLYRRFQSVRGVGPVLATAVLALVPEIGGLNDCQISKLVGVAPLERQSGKCLNVRHIGKGRLKVRRILYMAACSAVRFNRILRGYYERKRREGHPANWCIIPVMRKVLRLLNRMAMDPDFVPSDDSTKSPPREPGKAAPSTGKDKALFVEADRSSEALKEKKEEGRPGIVVNDDGGGGGVAV